MTRLREQIVRAKAENIKYIVIVIYQTTNKHVIVNHDPPPPPPYDVTLCPNQNLL